MDASSEAGRVDWPAHAQAQQLLALYQKALGHDLPNCLVAIQGLVRVLELEEGKQLSAAGREYLRRLTLATQRTAERVKLLADISRQLRRPQPLETVSLLDVLHEAVLDIKLLFPRRDIEYHFQEPLPTLLVTRSGLRQILVQLLRNAVQAVGEDQVCQLEVGAWEAPTAIEFWIADNGRGFAPEHQQLVLDELAGSESAVSSLGLGLGLVRHLVAGWQGQIQIHSRPGSGSRVTIVVPRRTSGSVQA